MAVFVPCGKEFLQLLKFNIMIIIWFDANSYIQFLMTCRCMQNCLWYLIPLTLYPYPVWGLKPFILYIQVSLFNHIMLLPFVPTIFSSLIRRCKLHGRISKGWLLNSRIYFQKLFKVLSTVFGHIPDSFSILQLRMLSTICW